MRKCPGGKLVGRPSCRQLPDAGDFIGSGGRGSVAGVSLTAGRSQETSPGGGWGSPARQNVCLVQGPPPTQPPPRLPRWARLRSAAAWALETRMGPVGGERGGGPGSCSVRPSLSGPVSSLPPHWPFPALVTGSVWTGLLLPILSQSWVVFCFCFFFPLSPTSSERLAAPPPLCPLLPHTTSNLDSPNENTLLFSL